MNLKNLEKIIPFQWRVQSFSKNKPIATIVAYIDSRDVMNILDEVVGKENWESDYKEIKGNLYAGIGIYINNKWVWKWDCGTESSTEKQKGEASDAFKRAGVKWGIGRFLYDLEIQYVDSDMTKKDGNYPNCINKDGKKISGKQLNDYINSQSKIREFIKQHGLKMNIPNEEVEKTKQQDINKKPIPETKPEVKEQPKTEQKPEVKKPINWITADGKKTVPEEKLQNMVATSFNNVLTQPLKVDEKKAQLTELKEKYINGFQSLSLSTDWFNKLYQESLTESHSF